MTRGGTSTPAGPVPARHALGGQARAPNIGVAGFVLAVVGIFLPPLGVVGLVLAVLGYAQAKRSNLPSRLCLAGVILGTIACFELLALTVQFVLTP